MNHQNDNKLDEFKDNYADTNDQNNDRIDKHKVNDDNLNDKYEVNSRDKKKIKSLKWWEDKKLKHVESLKGSENFKKRN